MNQRQRQQQRGAAASTAKTTYDVATSATPTIPTSVSKQLAMLVDNQGNNQNGINTSKRVPIDAADAISEALRLFVREAHRRASIEAECDDESEFRNNSNTNNDEILDDGDKNDPTKDYTTISAHHVTRIAGDLLMDFS